VFERASERALGLAVPCALVGWCASERASAEACGVLFQVVW
jgi:hypothetical protein